MKPQHHWYKQKRFLSPKSTSVLLYSTCLAILFIFYVFYYPKNTSHFQFRNDINQTNNTYIPPSRTNKPNASSKAAKQSDNCDIFKGQWVPDTRGSLYTNYSCKTIPSSKNCFLHGRRDEDFLQWRWKPDGCELPRFMPEAFLHRFRGKTLAFVGDSVSRNHMESLLCLLSKVETPRAVDKDQEGRFTTWEFPKHKFTLIALWSQFLVAATERMINGSSTGTFDLNLDRIDTGWSEKLPYIDYAIFSSAHWFFRPNYLFENGSLIGCIYCQSPNVTDLGPGLAIGKAFRAAFKEINTRKKKLFTLLRTYSPSHFENGTWNDGGDCNRTRPIGRNEVNKDGADLDYRKIQIEEIEIAKEQGEESGNIFEILDITEMMLMRGDGHPGVHWGNKWMKGYSDCVHWCLPGPIDTWNQLLLEVFKRRTVDVSG